MERAKRLGRMAGAVYLAVILTGFYSLAYVPAQLSGHGRVGALLANIASRSSLYNAGTVAFVLEQAAFIALPVLLFRLLGTVNRSAAVAMVFLAVVGVPVALMGAVFRLDVISWLGTAPLPGPDLPHVESQLAYAAVKHWDHVVLVCSLFWGLWLAPLGYLLSRLGPLPKIIGAVLMLGCVGYVVDFFGTILVAGYADLPLADYTGLPAALGEVGTCLWLLAVGAPRTLPLRVSHPI